MSHDIHAKISVIIPFYQVRPGILRRAVSSALQQSSVDNYEILVVDDESPVPALAELGSLVGQYPGRFRILPRRNGGPGAARNTALDNLSDDTEYVAFLDSDDVWTSTHLVRAVQTLARGFDFYFSDFFQLAQTTTAFTRAGRLRLTDHEPLDDSQTLYAYRGDMFSQILTGNVIGTPTVVYRQRALGTLRFREEYTHAGEDYLFWLECCRATSKFAFSSTPECTCGEGVNVYTGSGWGTERSLQRTHCELKYRKAVGQLFPLSPDLTAYNRQQIRRLRHYFIREMIHRLGTGKRIDRTVLRRQFAVDPPSLAAFAPVAVMTALLSIRRRVGGERLSR